MSVDRIQRLNELMRRELAASLYRIGQGDEVDLAKISFVDVEVARDLRSANVRVSFLAPVEEQGFLLNWIRGRRVDFQDWIARTMHLKYTPRLTFHKTSAIEKGSRVLSILENLGEQQGEDE